MTNKVGQVILYSGWLTPELCQERDDLIFVFGDNLKRVGMGGQAIIRTQPNAQGVATKRLPSMAPSAFFSETNENDLDSVVDDLAEVWSALKEGLTVVIPVTAEGKPSLGLERAELPQRAPSIYNTICMHVKEMCEIYGLLLDPDGEEIHSEL